METVRKPSFKVTYEGKDITSDVSKYLISCEYIDNTSKESDEITIKLEDTEGLWRNSWYPKKGDKIKLQIGYDETMFDCGTFTVDEMELQGPPDEITIRGLAAGINAPIRTKNSRAYESQTLRQIAQKVAEAHGLKLEDQITKITTQVNFEEDRSDMTRLEQLTLRVGTIKNLVRAAQVASKIANNIEAKGAKAQAKQLRSISNDIIIAATQVAFKTSGRSKADQVAYAKSNFIAQLKFTRSQLVDFTSTKTLQSILDQITIERVTQNRETDLAFLNRVAGDYGLMFSVRGDLLVFTSIYDIQKGKAVVVIDRTEMIRYSVKDKATQTFSKARLKYKNPKNNQVIEAEIKADEVNIPTGYETAPDVLELKCKAENKKQAEEKARAYLHKANTQNQEGHILVEGSPLLVAGNNFEISSMGEMSGKWHITRSRHKLDRGGYTTEVEIQRVDKPKNDATKTRKPKKEEKKEYPRRFQNVRDLYGRGGGVQDGSW